MLIEVFVILNFFATKLFSSHNEITMICKFALNQSFNQTLKKYQLPQQLKKFPHTPP
jgi:hypothetical protein